MYDFKGYFWEWTWHVKRYETDQDKNWWWVSVAKCFHFRPVGASVQIFPVNLNPSSIRCKLRNAWLAAFSILELPTENKKANYYWGSAKLHSLFCYLEDILTDRKRQHSLETHIRRSYQIRDNESNQHLPEQLMLFF